MQYSTTCNNISYATYGWAHQTKNYIPMTIPFLPITTHCGVGDWFVPNTKAQATANVQQSENIASNANGIKTPSLDARGLYKSLGLDKAGMDYKVFANAMVGYNKLKAQGKTNGYLGIFDITQDRNKERYYLIDLNKGVIVGRSVVKEGSNDCTNNVAKANTPNSHSTMPGFFQVGSEYNSSKGRPSEVLHGLEPCNANAQKKSVVIHPVKKGQQTTWGCLGYEPTASNTFADNQKKMRKLFPKGTIIFTCPKGTSDYWQKSTLCS